MKTSLFRIVALTTAVIIGSTAAVGASNLTISPTSVTLTNEPAADVLVTNAGNGFPELLNAFVSALGEGPRTRSKRTGSLSKSCRATRYPAPTARAFHS